MLGLTVREAQERIDAREFAEWCAFMQIEPDVGTRLDYTAGVIGALIGRVEASMGGKPPRLGPRLIEWGRDEADAQAEIFEQLVSRFGKQA